MKYDPQKHHRRSIRLPEYDYTQPGAYFITIVTVGKMNLFGEIHNGEMILNELGQIALEEWFKTAKLRPYVHLDGDEFQIMPNHMHGIIEIVDIDTVGTRRNSVRAERRSALTVTTPTAGSLGAIVRAYKSAVTYRINSLHDTRGAPVWQRNYFERVIRNEKERGRIRRYIQANPVQ
jgi:putative transposase